MTTLPRLLTDVSIWSADMTCLKDEIRRVDDFVDGYHFDISDAHFVPGLLLFPDLVAALRPLTSRPFHVHLMVANPLNLIEDFVKAGANRITVHLEIGELLGMAIEKIKANGATAGLGFGLDTPLEGFGLYLEMVDLILMMGTPMGIKGQELSPQANERIKEMREIIDGQGYRGKILLEADGGIRNHSIPGIFASGADCIVPGSLVFKSKDLHTTFTWLRTLHRIEVSS